MLSQCACWYLLVQDPVSISILITRISDAVSICVLLARVWHILAVILMGKTAQSHALVTCLSQKVFLTSRLSVIAWLG